MKLFTDIQSPGLLYFKGALFGIITIMTAALLLLTDHLGYKTMLLLVCIWSSCRFYYFFFYVLDHYVGGEKNAGIYAMLLKMLRKRRKMDGSRQADNLFSDLPVSLPEEQVDELVVFPDIRIERILSTGQESPAGFWYDQSENEWVAVLQGEALLEFEGEKEPRHLRAGDYVMIPAHQKHRVARTATETTTVWLAVFWEGEPLPSPCPIGIQATR